MSSDHHHHHTGHPLVLVCQSSFESASPGSLEPSENMSTMAHHDVQADSDLLVLLVALTGSESTGVTRRFVQVDSSESVEPARQLETQVGPSHSLESVVTMSPIQTRGTRRESPFAINGDRPSHASLDDSDSPPRLGTSSIRAPTSPQTALSPTFESHRDNDDPTALRKSKAQSVCSASLNVTWTNREVVVSTHRK